MLNRAALRPLIYALAALLLPLAVACSSGDDDNSNDSGLPSVRPATSAAANPTATTPASNEPLPPANCPEGVGLDGKARSNTRRFNAPPARVITPSKSYVATMKTAKGTIVIQLDAASAPNTVNNFVFLSCHGFYDGLNFHRVEPNFVIQGGDPMGNGRGDAGYKFASEVKLKHDKAGVLSMANSGPNTNGSQFFITQAPAPHLDTGQVGFFNAFGQVTEGMDVVLKIAVGDKIESISIEEK